MKSEDIFNFNRQPSITCPFINNFINSIFNIGEYKVEENFEGDMIEVEFDISPDFSSLKSALDNAEDIKEWCFQWLDLMEDNIMPFIDDIIKSFQNNKELEDEEISLLSLSEDLKEQYTFFTHPKKSIQSIMNDIEKSYDKTIFLTDKYDSSAIDEAENFRSLITDLREECNLYKNIIKDLAFTIIPELEEFSYYNDNINKYKEFHKEKIKKQLNNTINQKKQSIHINI